MAVAVNSQLNPLENAERQFSEAAARLKLDAGIMELLNAATGAGYTLDELCLAGERIFNAERLFLMRAGFSAKDDTLPERILKQPLPDGPAKGMVCHLDEMLDDLLAYWRARAAE